MRDVLMFGVGAVAGAAALGLVGLGLQGGGPHAADAASEEATGAPFEAPGPLAAVTAILASGEADAVAAESPAEPAACLDPNTPPPGGAVIWDEDGPKPCDAACVRGFAEAALAPGATDEEIERAFQASNAVAGLVAQDDVLRRAYLRQLLSLRVPDPMDPEGGYEPRAAFLTTLAMSGNTGLAVEAGDRLLASADPFTRAAGMNVLSSAAYDDPRAAARIEESFTREPEGPVLLSAIHSLHAVGEGASARTKARLRDLARNADDPQLRIAALQHVGAYEPEAARSLIHEAASSPSALVRLGALQMETWNGDARESQVERLRDAARAIADDPDADPEARMGALGLLTYELTNRPYRDHDDH